MRSMPSRPLLLAILCLPLLSTACATRSTPALLARTERPTLPTLSPELTKAERLTPVSGKLSGEPVTIDKGWLSDVLERFAEAIGAVERGNNRAAGVKLERRCTSAMIATGIAPAACSK